MDSAINVEQLDSASGVTQGCTSNIRQLDRRDVESVQRDLSAKYGFDVTPEYAADLIAFVEELTGEPRG